MLDKASPIQIFTRITFPLMQPYIVLVIILLIIFVISLVTFRYRERDWRY
jgi:ABC-type sugar transport system permease subunit